MNFTKKFGNERFRRGICAAPFLNVMDKEKIDRLNELARKAKEFELTAEEKDEQMILREEYRAAIRENFHNTMSNTYIKRPDGTMEKVTRKNTKPTAEC